MEKTTLGLIAAAISLYCFVPYFYGMYKKQVHPHLFSWMVWSIVLSISFFAQRSQLAGPGMWVSGISAVGCTAITLLAFNYGEKSYTKSDWIAFILALCAIPLWMATHTPLYSVILITVLDALALWPTCRKSWNKPFEEALQSYTLSGVKFAVSLFALNQITVITALYPASIVVTSTCFTIMVLVRRTQVKRS